MSSREQVEGAAVRALPLIKLACSLLSRSNQRGSPSDRPAPSLRVQSAGPSWSSVLWPVVVWIWLLRKDRCLITGSVEADALSHRPGGRAVSGLVAPREGPVCKPCRAAA